MKNVEKVLQDSIKGNSVGLGDEWYGLFSIMMVHHPFFGI